MIHQDLRQKFLDFFRSKGHAVITSAPLVPLNDPSVLFTTAGMQQFKPYYTGIADAQKDFGSLNTTSIQKCVRTSDIDEVGDERHLTFFEMLGNFSFGGYFKKEAIEYAHEFITKTLGLQIDYVSVFGGEGSVPADDESEQIWKSLDQNIVVKKFSRADNFWGPTGEEGPCGPTTEIYVNSVEVWNIVFNQYFQKKDGTLEPLKTPGIDTGMGLERLAKVVQKVPTVFETDLFASLIALLPTGLEDRVRRIIVDHCRAIIFLLADGVMPSNKEQGYVLRRLMRRVIVYERLHKFSADPVLVHVIEQYGGLYPELSTAILSVWRDEQEKFTQTLERGLKELAKVALLDADAAFTLYESYGLPYEVIKEVGSEKAESLTREAFDVKLKEHQEKSRTASAGMFKGGLADQSEIVVRYHTATHLLNSALRRVLGDHIMQKGSNLNAERLRFDFSHPAKLTDKEKSEVEKLVNGWIANDLPVVREEMSQEQARTLGAIGVFGEKYGNVVSIYTVSDPKTGDTISREFCGGPHVTHTREIGVFKILKEEAVSSGIRRIRATIS